MGAALAVVASGIALCTSGLALADVGWFAPSGCPSAAQVQERIQRRLPDHTSIDEVGWIGVHVERSGGQYIATIDTRSISRPRGRTLTAPGCNELADAVALIVARLATDALREAADDPEGPAVRNKSIARKLREAGNVAVVDAEIEMLPMSVERSRRPPTKAPPPSAWSGGMRALALSGIGMTPDVGVGADLAAFVQRDDKFAELGFAKWAPRPMYLLPGGIGQVDFGVHLVALRAGWASPRMPLRGWIGVELGSMRGEGMELRSANTGRWIAIASGFGVGWPLSPRTRVVGTFEVAVPIERATFTFMDGTSVREPAPISARSALGLELAWR